MAEDKKVKNLATVDLVTDPQDSDALVLERNGNIQRVKVGDVLEHTSGTLSDTVKEAQTAAKSLDGYKSQVNALVDKISATDVSSIENRVTSLEAQTSDIKNGADKYVNEYCGRYWNFNNQTPKAAGYVGNLQMLKDLPDLLNLGGYLVKNDHTRRKLSSHNHHFYVDGTPAKLDGTEGHYQAGWNRKWYVLWEWDANTKILTEKIRISPAVGYYEVPVASDSASGFATIDRTNNKLVSYCNKAAQYRGANNNAANDGKYNSFLGLPASSQTTENFMNMAKKNGSGWLAGTGRMIAAWTYLFTAIMGTLHIQDSVNTQLDSNGLRQGGLGAGDSYDWGQWTTLNGNQPFLPMDAGADKGDYVGTIPYTITIDGNGTKKTFNTPCFFGMKSFYCYLYKQCCDEFLSCNSDGSQTHYQVIAPYYSDFTFGTIDSKVRKGSTGPVYKSANWQYISREALNGFELMPTEANASSSTLFTDGYYNPVASSGLRLCFRLAYASDGGHAGCWCLRGGIGIGDANGDWGSSLSEAATEFRVTPLTQADLAA